MNRRVAHCISLVIVFVLMMQVLTAQQDTIKSRYRLKDMEAGLVSVGMLAVTAYTMDAFIRDFSQANQSPGFDKFFDVANYAGDAKFGLVLPVLYGLGMVLKDEPLKRTAWISIQSCVVSSAGVVVFKHVLGRARPFNDLGPYYYEPFPQGFDDDYYSMPSGHASFAWSLFTPFAEEYSRWLYLVPVTVSAARIYKDKHWLSDVICGGAIGYFTALSFYKKPSKKVKIIGNSIILYL